MMRLGGVRGGWGVGGLAAPPGKRRMRLPQPRMWPRSFTFNFHWQVCQGGARGNKPKTQSQTPTKVRRLWFNPREGTLLLAALGTETLRSLMTAQGPVQAGPAAGEANRTIAGGLLL